ncbi:MAG: hypothetical protein E7350_02235 [Clostridiales bacterium]|nr:hypothetical protein [Clostridiales bacterium]
MSYLKVKGRSSSRVSVNNFLAGVNATYDPSVLGFGVAENCYNFDFTSGALKGCIGFETMSLTAQSMWVFKKGEREIFMFYKNGRITYTDNLGNSGSLQGITLTGKPKAIGYRLNGEDVVLICSPTDRMVVWNGVDSPYYVDESPLITSMTVHYERLFVTTGDEKNTLWFSDDLDPSNWDTSDGAGGFIELADDRGALIKVLSFLNYVYIFRERGISRLTAYAEQSEFSISHLFVTGGRIYPESIALCGDRVIFASSDGIFSFDGVSTRRILTNLDGLLVPDENSVAVYRSGKYYLATRANFGQDGSFSSSYTNNALLIYGDDGYTLMRGYDITSLYSYGDALYAVIGGRVYTHSGKCDKPKRWSVPQTDLGSGRNKRIKVLYIDTATDITLTVNIDGAKKVYLVKGSSTTSRVNINLCGRKFGMTIDCTADSPRISRPQLVFSFVDD